MLPPLASWLKVARVSANLSNADTSQRPADSVTGGALRPAASAGATQGPSDKHSAAAAPAKATRAAVVSVIEA